MVSPDEPLVVAGEGPRFVGRGGEKLAGAVERFGLAPVIEGARALDAGASTGGFTDCLLQNGAAAVVAVDVGYGQLHERLRTDPRVEVHDRTNIREVKPGDLGPPFDVVVADLSFISLRLVLAPMLALARPGTTVVTLVKPQFEAGRQAAAKGRGVIRDPDVWREVLGRVQDAFAGCGATIMGAMVSPIHGADGNVEFLVHACAGASATDSATGDVSAAAVADGTSGGRLDVERLVAEALAPVTPTPAPAGGS
jgi:23S rRNA (cytidine1920-2'-O)/16S rRNA (cytidine1409-2'-O)-methyltransferase